MLALYRYRHFILTSVLSEFKSKFIRSQLGWLWSILHPLVQAAVFAVILSEVLGAKLAGVAGKAAYPVYLMAGLAAWGLFNEIVSRCLTVFLEYGSAMKKIAFPRLCLPVILFSSAVINHLLLLASMCVVFYFIGHLPGTAWFALPIGIALIAMTALGLGIILGVLNVFIRDVAQVMTVVLQLWFWLTPIVYTVETLPAHLQWISAANILTPLVRVYQDAMLRDLWPDPVQLLLPTSTALLLICAAYVLFKRASEELVDVL